MFERDPLLLIMRHAQSELPNYKGKDFDRPLDPQGEQQPALMASKLRQMSIEIDQAVLSPAQRTTQTFTLLTQALAKPLPCESELELYNASFGTLLNVLQKYSENVQKLLIVGHNPSVSDAVNYLTGEFHRLNPANIAILRGKSAKLSSSIELDCGFTLVKILAP